MNNSNDSSYLLTAIEKLCVEIQEQQRMIAKLKRNQRVMNCTTGVIFIVSFACFSLLYSINNHTLNTLESMIEMSALEYKHVRLESPMR
jgi:hypothetical protein